MNSFGETYYYYVMESMYLLLLLPKDDHISPLYGGGLLGFVPECRMNTFYVYM